MSDGLEDLIEYLNGVRAPVEAERDSARRWAKAWKRAAVNWRYSWCGADGRAQRAWAQAQRTREKAEADLARLTAERDAIQRELTRAAMALDETMGDRNALREQVKRLEAVAEAARALREWEEREDSIPDEGPDTEWWNRSLALDSALFHAE